jgi:hypothetical protein
MILRRQCLYKPTIRNGGRVKQMHASYCDLVWNRDNKYLFIVLCNESCTTGKYMEMIQKQMQS